MLITINNLLALEMAFKEEEKKDESGNYKPTGKRFPYAIFYPFNQGVKYSEPTTMMFRVPEEMVSTFKTIQGKICAVTADQVKGKNGFYYIFQKCELETKG